MKQVITYFIDLSDTKEEYYVVEIKAFCIISPHNGKKIYLLPSDEESISLYEDDLADNWYYLTKEKADAKCFEINNPSSRELAFLEVCKKFKEACDEFGYNPFFRDGENAITKGNQASISKVQDPVLKYFLQANFSYYLQPNSIIDLMSSDANI